DCPVAPTSCFDNAGKVDPSNKKCTSSADCVTVDYLLDCCGSVHSAGVSKASEAAVKACAATRKAGFPACACAGLSPEADDGSHDTGGAAGTKTVFCNTAGLCETSFKGAACGTNVCGPSQTCCDGMPLPEPTCINGNICPISQRKYKKDISYLSE